MVYSAQFSKVDYGRVFAVGGIGSTQVYLYNSDTKTCAASISDIPKAVYSLDFANSSDNVAVGSGDGIIRVFSYREHHENLDIEE